MFERKKALKEIEEKLNTVQMYLENNYKDLTLQSYKDAKEVVERYEKSSLLKQKDSHADIVLIDGGTVKF